MISLCRNITAPVVISPRWPDQQVMIDEKAWACLCATQSLLSPDIQLILTRTYQPETSRQRWLRKIGSLLFYALYPTRRTETKAIFLHNGHATNGTHIDISIKLRNKRLHFLPLSVFTPRFLMRY